MNIYILRTIIKGGILWQKVSSLQTKVMYRIIRIIIGIVLLALGIFVYKRTLAIVLIIIAIIALVTCISGFCGFYKLFGISIGK
jgi:hypothetical protein